MMFHGFIGYSTIKLIISQEFINHPHGDEI
jgi:hypothetical protein